MAATFRLADSGAINFGNDTDITLTHVHNSGLTLKHSATGDDKPVVFTLATGETDIALNDVIGAINFQAPDEGTGTAAILVAAGIEAVSEGDFAANNNATKLSFKTGASEAAAEKMKLSSTGVLTLNGSGGSLVIPNGKTIGCAADTDLITLTDGVVTVAGDLTVNGETTTVNTTNTVVKDRLIELANGASSSTADAGIVIERGSTGNNAFIGWDESADKFTVGTTTATGASTGHLSITTGTLVANLEGNVTGNVTGNCSGTAATVTNAAQSNITSLGTLTTLTVDNVIINGTTIGHADDTDLITLADGVVTVAGEISVTTLDIAGTNVSATAAELNILDGGTSATSTTVADAHRVVLNDNGTMKQVAVTDLAAYFDDEITAMPNLVTVGALNSGSITSGFGNIDTGSSTITTTGLITGGSLDIDHVVINGTTIGHTDDTDLITLANGVVTVAGEISVTTLDIGGTDVTATAAELNLLDGATGATSTILVDADRIIVNDAGIMKQVALSDLKTYVGVSATSLNGLSDVLVENNSIFIGNDPSSTTSLAERNIAVGVTALDAITTGDDNVCVGEGSGKAITTDSQNTLIGKHAGLVQASVVQVTGQTSQNNGNGNATTIELAEAASSEDDFYNGSVIKITGGGSGGADIYGQITDYVGSTRIATFRELEGTTVTGTDNKSYVIGGGHLADNKTNNVSVGYDSCKALTRGFSNTIVGSESGTSVTTGYRNTTLGYAAGDALTTGYNNTVIGYNSSASSAVIANEVTLGDSNVTTLRCGATTIASLSDRRDKTDIKDSAYGLNLINRVRPVEFTWKTREGSSKDGTTNIGFIAQELRDAMEEGENDKLRLVYESNPDRLEAMYGNLVPVMAKAIQELSQQVEELKARLDKQN